MTPIPPHILITAEEAAQMLNVKRNWLYQAVRRDEIPHVRVGRLIRFSPIRLAEWAEQRANDGA